MEKVLHVYKVESCQQQRRFSFCKYLSLVSFVNSFQFFHRQGHRVIVAPLKRTVCLLSALPQFSLIVELLLTCIHPVTIYFNSPFILFFPYVGERGGELRPSGLEA